MLPHIPGRRPYSCGLVTPRLQYGRLRMTVRHAPPMATQKRHANSMTYTDDLIRHFRYMTAIL